MAKHPPPKTRPTPAVKTIVEVPDDDAPRASNGAAKVTGAKNRQASAIRETEVLQAVAGLNMDAVSGTIASTQVEVQKSLAALSAKLVDAGHLKAAHIFHQSVPLDSLTPAKAAAAFNRAFEALAQDLVSWTASPQ